MQPLAAMQEPAELAASYSADDVTLRLAAIVVVDSSVVPAHAGTQTQACSQREVSGLSADARSRGSSALRCANDRRMDSSVRWNDGICGRE